MSLNPHSSEFAHLVTAWLDETATAEEAAQLWQAVAESPECALEFAAAARFESLLAETVQERAGEKTALRQVVAGQFKTPPQAKDRAPAARRWQMPLRAAAAIALLSSLAWLLWPAAETPKMAEISSPKPGTVPTVSHSPAAPVRRLPLVSPVAADAADTGGKSLPQRLDSFFLAGVALDQVPLREALGILQGQLQELNFLNAEALQKLRVTVPADAAGRRITFHSGSIAFLKAVRAVAALGGCEVTVDEPTLALILQRGIFPQVAERRDLRNILAGRVNADGTAAASDPDRLAALMADASSLGIALDPTRPLAEQASLPMTRGQWAALQLLTDTREQLSQFPMPNFQLYLTEGDPSEADKVIEEDQAKKMQANFQSTGTAPVAVVTPVLSPLFALGSQAPTLPPITAQPLGEVTQVTVNWSLPPSSAPTAAEPTPEQPAATTVTGVLLAGQGMSTMVDSATASRLSGSSSVSFSAFTNLVLLPDTNAPRP
ncbi:MAG: hypothetical protein U0984_01475, partial [Prosthecobacter sp.]|nr:hypothetical protein [Prosthecobacter sp.]